MSTKNAKTFEQYVIEREEDCRKVFVNDPLYASELLEYVRKDVEKIRSSYKRMNEMHKRMFGSFLDPDFEEDFRWAVRDHDKVIRLLVECIKVATTKQST